MVPFDLAFIRRMAEAGRALCPAAAREASPALASLPTVEVTILSDKKIARVHAEFFGDAAPTDVITFDHGEILLGAGVIAANAARYGQRPDEEAALCAIHGLLHLAGWKDGAAREARRMARMQEQIFKRVRAML